VDILLYSRCPATASLPNSHIFSGRSTEAWARCCCRSSFGCNTAVRLGGAEWRRPLCRPPRTRQSRSITLTAAAPWLKSASVVSRLGATSASSPWSPLPPAPSSGPQSAPSKIHHSPPPFVLSFLLPKLQPNHICTQRLCETNETSSTILQALANLPVSLPHLGTVPCRLHYCDAVRCCTCVMRSCTSCYLV
jgi:hypothetical protein